MKLEIKDFYALYYGGGQVTNSSRYLWKQINEDESPGAYSRRLERASYPNFQNKIVNIVTDYVFWGAPKIDGTPNFDILELAHSSLTHSLIGGISYILVTASGPKVYPAFMVIFDEHGNVKIENNQGDYILIQIDSEGNGILETWKDDNKINEEPFTSDQLIKCRWDDSGSSFIRDTSAINLQIYNLQSVLDTLCLHAGIFITSGASIGDAKKIIPFQHIPTAQGEAPVEFKAPPVVQIKEVRAEIDRRISIMAAIVGLSQEFAEEIRIETGEARKWRMLDINATVLQISRNVAKCVNEAARVDSELNGGQAVTLQLEPLLNPEGDLDKMAKLDNIIQTIQIDEIIKAAQAEKVKIAFNDLSEGQKLELLRKVETDGGLKSLRRNELDLPQDM